MRHLRYIYSIYGNERKIMQLHILNNPKDAALAADAEFLKQSLFNLLHEEASPLVVETVKLLSTSDDSAALIEKVLPQLDEQQTHDLTLACGLFARPVTP